MSLLHMQTKTEGKERDTKRNTEENHAKKR